jgi:hypothetical protein
MVGISKKKRGVGLLIGYARPNSPTIPRMINTVIVNLLIPVHVSFREGIFHFSVQLLKRVLSFDLADGLVADAVVSKEPDHLFKGAASDRLITSKLFQEGLA